jgi:2,3-bisphosphoglycerate-dependent phosphoglycerate mutase
MRRGWDYPIPEGESLKQVYERVVAYYTSTILPELETGKNVIISSSGNALRSLVKYLEHISDEDISNLEIATGEVYVYKLDGEGKILNKEIRNQHPNTA